ncbi:DUF2860 family protein [Psychromonas ingrahamii]
MGYKKEGSDIDFYDTKGLFISTGLSYQF